MEEKLDKIIELLEVIAINTSTYKGYAIWTEEQEEMLLALYKNGTDISAIIEKLKEDFDVQRTHSAIRARLSKLGIK